MIRVGERLRLDALRRIDDQQGTLTGLQSARDTSYEKSTCPGRVDQIQDVVLIRQLGA